MLGMTLLIGLAGYRLWRLLARDTILDGPRDWVYDRARGHRVGEWLVELADCVWCLGFWITGMLTAMAALSLDWSAVQVALVWPAASAIAGFAARLDPRQ